MKKLILIFLLTELISLKSTAQQEFGIKGGVNISTIENYFIYAGNSNKYKIGLNAGIFTRFKFKKLLFQPELFYSQKGSNYTTSIGDRTLNLNYFSLPLLGGYALSDKFTFLAGPELNFGLGIPTAFKKFDLTINFGLSYNLKKIGFDIRYDYGFDNLAEGYQLDQNGNETNQKKVFGSNKVILIGLTYILSRSK